MSDNYDVIVGYDSGDMARRVEAETQRLVALGTAADDVQKSLDGIARKAGDVAQSIERAADSAIAASKKYDTAARTMDRAADSALDVSRAHGTAAAQTEKAAASAQIVGQSYDTAAKSATRAAMSTEKAAIETEEYSQAARRGAASSGIFNDGVRRLAMGLGLLVAGFFSVHQAQEAVFDFNQFDRIQRSLEVATGSAENGADAYAMLRSESERLGLVLEPVASSYSSLAAAMSQNVELAGHTETVFLGVAEAGAALTLSADQMEGALRAVEQMASKGNVQAEELRGQLGERIPGAFQIAARAMGVTTTELNKMLERGEVLASDFLPKFGAELRRTFGPGAAKGAQALSADINRFKTAVFEARVAFVEEFAPQFQETVQKVTSLLKENEDAVREFGRNVATALDLAVDGAQMLANNADVLSVAVAALIGFKLAPWILAVGTAATTATLALNPFAAAIAAVAAGGMLLGNVIDDITAGISSDISAIVQETEALEESWRKTTAAIASGDAKKIAAQTQEITEAWIDADEELQQFRQTALGFESNLQEIADAAGVSLGVLQAWAGGAEGVSVQTTETREAVAAMFDEMREADRGAAQSVAEQKKLEQQLGNLSEAYADAEGAASKLVRTQKIDMSPFLGPIAEAAKLAAETDRVWVHLGVTWKEAGEIAKTVFDFRQEAQQAGLSAQETADGVRQIEDAALAASGRTRELRSELKELIETPPIEIDIRVSDKNLKIDKEAISAEVSAGFAGMDDFDPSVFFPDPEQLDKLSEGLTRMDRAAMAAGETMMIVADALWDIDRPLANFIGNLGNLVATLSDPNASAGDKDAAAAGLISAGFGAAFGGERRTEFGGLDTTYAAEGAELGAQFGGAWGALIGGVVGAMVDNVEKATIDVLADAEGQMYAQVTKADEGLKRFADIFAAEVNRFVRGFEEEVGVQLAAVDTSVKVKGEYIEVQVGDVTALFKSMEGALAFLQERLIIANRDMGTFAEGVGENVERLISGLSKRTMRGSAQDLQDALSLASDADFYAETGVLRGSGTGADAVLEQGSEILARFSRDLELAAQYGLNFSDVIALTDARLAELRGSIEEGFAQLVGARDFLGPILDLVGQMDAYGTVAEQTARDRIAAAEQAEADVLRIEEEIAAIREQQSTQTITDAQGAQREVSRLSTGMQGMREDMRLNGESMGRMTTGMTDGIDGAAAAGNRFADQFTDLTDGTYEGAKSLQDLERELEITSEKAEGLRASLEDIPAAFSAEEIANVWETGALQAGQALEDLMKQIQGGSYDAQAAEERRQDLFRRQMIVQIAQTRLYLEQLKAIEGISQVLLDGLLDTIERAESDLAGLESGELSLSGAGGGRRRAQREAAEAARRDELAALAALEEEAAERTGALADAVDDFLSTLDLADRLDTADEKARALAAGLTILQRSMLDMVEGLDVAGLGDLYAQVVSELGTEDVPPELRAALESFLSQIREATEQAARDHLSDVQNSIREAVESGDVGAVEDLFAEIQQQLESLPPELREGLEEFEDQLGRRMRRAIRRATENAIQGAQEAVSSMTVSGSVAKQWDDLTQQIAEQRKVIEEAAISEGRRRRELEEFDKVADQVFLEFGAQVAGQLNSSIEGAAQRFGIELAPEELFELRKLEFEVAMAKNRAEIELLQTIGVITAETAERLNGVLDKVTAAAEENLYLPVKQTQELAGAISSLSSAVTGFNFESLADIRDALDRWEEEITRSSNPLLAEAMEINRRREEFEAALDQFGPGSTEYLRDRLEEVAGLAVQTLIDGALEPFENLGIPQRERELRDLLGQFLDIQEAFDELAMTEAQRADAEERLAAARAAALADFWDQATKPLQNFLDELTATDPRRTSEEIFETSQQRFRDLAERARAGDFEALEQLEAAGREYLAQSQGFLGSGPGSLAARDEIRKAIEQILGGGIDPFAERLETGDQAIVDNLEDFKIAQGEKIDTTNQILGDIYALMSGTSAAPALRIERPAPQMAPVFERYNAQRLRIARTLSGAGAVQADPRSAGGVDHLETLEKIARMLEEHEKKEAERESRRVQAAEARRREDGTIETEKIRELRKISAATTATAKKTARRSGLAGGVSPRS